MPELPEVETVRRGLQPHLEGKIIRNAVQNRADLRFPLPENFAQRLVGRRVVSVDRRAKYLLIRMDDGMVWLAHLGMTGRFTVDPADGLRATSGQAGHNSGWIASGKHDHVAIETEEGTRIVFNDARRFGYMDLVSGNALEASRHLAGLGPEPLGPDFTAEALSDALKGKKTPIKAALLDQKVVAGLGNIYVCEALWQTGISPKRSAHTVAGIRAARLVPAIREILQRAIEAGGSSLRDFVRTDGELGYFQHSWSVYDHEGEPCSLAGCGGTITRLVQSGRSSFYCPKHQR